MASFKALPGTNFGTFFALILITSPVCGFLPFLAFLLSTLNVPNPTNVTAFFFFNDFVIVAKTQSTAARSLYLCRLRSND